MKIKASNVDIYFEVDNLDFDRINKFKWFISGKCVYRTFWNGWKNLHRNVAQEIFNKDIMFDHKDRDFLNNKRSNLRKCNDSQNNANRKRPGKCSSQYRGVYKRKVGDKLWGANISINKRMKNLGSFDNEIEAALAYDDAAIIQFGEFARLNFQLYGA